MSDLDVRTRYILVTVPACDANELDDILDRIDVGGMPVGTSARTVDAAPILAEVAEWADERADLSDAEDRGEADSDDWHASDDAGCDLASRFAAIFHDDQPT